MRTANQTVQRLAKADGLAIDEVLGGPVADMQRMLADRMASGTIPEIRLDPREFSEALLRVVSRATGIVALLTGFAGTATLASMIL